MRKRERHTCEQIQMRESYIALLNLYHAACRERNNFYVSVYSTYDPFIIHGTIRLGKSR
jgi:hypothetical protein